MTPADTARVRVLEASLAGAGGPVRVVLSALPSARVLADALAARGLLAAGDDERVETVAVPDVLAGVVAAAFGEEGAAAVERALAVALAGWSGPPPPLDTRAGQLDLSAGPAVMGVLNVTPDSFSDGGLWFDVGAHPGRAVEHGLALAGAGAAIVDVGGESTRPGASPVEEGEELERVVPVVEGLASEGVAVSIDTTKASVARAAVAAGAALVNDVSGGALDGHVLPTVAELRVPYVLTHMRGTPRTMQRDPRYGDVVAEVFEFLAEGVARCAAAGIDPSAIVVDPGIGFGKTAAHNLELIRRLRELTSLGRPVLVGTSRKSFIGRVTGVEDPRGRLGGSLAAAALAVASGAGIVRAHDVAETLQAVAVAHAVATAGPAGPDDR